MSGSITLHKIAKTGTYSDLIGKPTIPAAPGTLNTNNTTAQTAKASEALSGTISLHKVAKTGTYSDLIGTPTIPTESTVSGWGFTKNSGTVTSVKVGTTSYSPSSGVVSLPAYPSVPTAMTATEANTGTATTARTIGASTNQSAGYNLFKAFLFFFTSMTTTLKGWKLTPVGARRAASRILSNFSFSTSLSSKPLMLYLFSSISKNSIISPIKINLK